MGIGQSYQFLSADAECWLERPQSDSNPNPDHSFEEVEVCDWCQQNSAIDTGA